MEHESDWTDGVAGVGCLVEVGWAAVLLIGFIAGNDDDGEPAPMPAFHVVVSKSRGHASH